MNPKEKATLIVHQMYGALFHTNSEPAHVKQCALIAVDEIIAQIEPSVSMDVISASIKYWNEVKKEIENL